MFWFRRAGRPIASARSRLCWGAQKKQTTRRAARCVARVKKDSTKKKKEAHEKKKCRRSVGFVGSTKFPGVRWLRRGMPPTWLEAPVLFGGGRLEKAVAGAKAATASFYYIYLFSTPSLPLRSLQQPRCTLRLSACRHVVPPPPPRPFFFLRVPFVRARGVLLGVRYEWLPNRRRAVR